MTLLFRQPHRFLTFRGHLFFSIVFSYSPPHTLWESLRYLRVSYQFSTILYPCHLVKCVQPDIFTVVGPAWPGSRNILFTCRYILGMRYLVWRVYSEKRVHSIVVFSQRQVRYSSIPRPLLLQWRRALFATVSILSLHHKHDYGVIVPCPSCS